MDGESKKEKSRGGFEEEYRADRAKQRQRETVLWGEFSFHSFSNRVRWAGAHDSLWIMI